MQKHLHTHKNSVENTKSREYQKILVIVFWDAQAAIKKFRAYLSLVFAFNRG